MGNSAGAAVRGTVIHSERLYVPWWNWPLPLIMGGLLAMEIDMGYPGVRAWLPYAGLGLLVVIALVVTGRTKVRVTSGDEPELWVGDAHLPLRYVGEVEIIDKKHKRKALGQDADPAAFVLHRGWVGPVLRIRLTDPEDPTPYWLFSTRKPEELAALLRGGH